MFECFCGKSAYSDFRLEALAKKIGLPGQLQAHWLYFLDLKRPLSEDEKKTLSHLLQCMPRSVSDLAGRCLIVTPRIGTISPWSTKATDILAHCQLDAVRRVERGLVYVFETEAKLKVERFLPLLYDEMTQHVHSNVQTAKKLFEQHGSAPHIDIPVVSDGREALVKANVEFGWALSEAEIDYLYDFFATQKRNPTDVELMMFAQANSEHCRHKIFNASWEIDGQEKPYRLFQMIKNTANASPQGLLSAYKDNASVIEGQTAKRFYAKDGVYQAQEEPVHILMKVETHNHPTAISPHPGAATGAGGEIRDEGAVGRGSKPKAGLTGFSVSHLCIPGHEQPWEVALGKPRHMQSALQIMLEGPIGGAAFNNEFGRPNIAGYFRSYTQHLPDGRAAGYHKPIMIAGGMGNIKASHVEKHVLEPDTYIIVLGGPAMKIGLGGGAASSMNAGQGSEALDFASVQRDNPEMQRRAQEVIDACWALDNDNPIASIHDVGAGGLCNAIPEIVNDCERGALINLRRVPVDEPGMSPMAIWCNESQERYVLAVSKTHLARFEDIAKRERCPYAILGQVRAEEQLTVLDPGFENKPVDVPMDWLFGQAPKLKKQVKQVRLPTAPIKTDKLGVGQAAQLILRHPTVADKSFLITIGDRSVTGLIARDQMVGPYQVPVSDVAVTANSYWSHTGEAMAMGERPPLALISPAASSRMAVGEAITNIAAAQINHIGDIRLSANWMAACGEPGQDAALYEAVEAIGMDLCPALGIAIPVGKDSLSMKTTWSGQKVFSPVSCIISAFAPVTDINKTWTPMLEAEEKQSLLYIDLGEGKNRLGGSIYSEITHQLGDTCPDTPAAELLKTFFEAMQVLHKDDLVMAYHDKGDGGLWATLVEMAIAGRCGWTIDIAVLGDNSAEALFNEELGAVIQVRQKDVKAVRQFLKKVGLGHCTHAIGQATPGKMLIVYSGTEDVLFADRVEAHRDWSGISFIMQRRRDNPSCAESALTHLTSPKNSLTIARATVRPEAPMLNTGTKPKVAILREQGVNGHVEMAAAFSTAGFEAHDVHMSDLIAGHKRLQSYQGLVACGGFSFGDVLGAGGGWAKGIVYHPALKEMFEGFFGQDNTFALGVCNGCQMLSQLKTQIPGAGHWPAFVRNQSEQFEARLSLVRIEDSPSLFFKDMAGSILPVAVAHGEGQVQYGEGQQPSLVACRYVDGEGDVTTTYPMNPNGSAAGITGLTSEDGRVTIMMPHPERVFRNAQLSWRPKDWDGEYSPWMQMFLNARAYVN